MKITKEQLKQLIKEELESVTEYGGRETYSPGDFIEIRISDDGHETSTEKIDPKYYKNTRSPYAGAKMLAKVVQVATDVDEDY